ncbi:MAG: nucleotide exchange factor GrpE, partial [Chloroflexi bacterium]|nr:nucleotide exchange factor GrpE [Chloroflexota bacterium]
RARRLLTLLPAVAFESVDHAVVLAERAWPDLLEPHPLVEPPRPHVRLQRIDEHRRHVRRREAAREREVAQLREQIDRAQGEAQREIVKRLLPVLDGLDEAIAAGEALLAEEERPVALSFRQRAREAWRILRGESSDVVAPYEHWAAWLRGVEFVRARLLEVLAAEGVQPIETEGQPFDPNRHHAVEVITAADTLSAGLIVQETRRGYMCGDNVLRYAEVVVVR